MRTIFTLALTLITAFAFAQDVQSTDKMMSLGKQPAIYVDIEGADKKIAENSWKEFMKNYGKTKRNKKAKEYQSQDIRIPMLAGGNVDLYTKFEEGSGQTTVYLWVVDEGSFADASDGAENFLGEYYVLARKKVISKEIEEQEKLLKKLTKNMEKLVKKNQGYHKDIEKAEEKIRKAEENIEKNLVEQDNAKVENEKQKKVLEALIEKLNNVGKE